jgi:UDP-N-acetylmuramoyl-tripeptide--D-alanyl-D-alanine ligase
MPQLLIRDVTGAIDGHVQFGSLPPLGGDAEPIGRIVADVRDIQPGDVWWALETSPYDSACRAHEAFMRGALGVVVQGCGTEPWAGRFRIAVEDTRWALWQLAGAARRRFLGSLIAVGGSLGKRTTRHLIDAVLRQRYEGLVSCGDLPPRVSVPLMLSMLDETHDFGLVAYTSRKKGEIQAISHLCCPDVAVINSFTIERPTEAAETAGHEAELVRQVSRDGCVVLNGDDPDLVRLAVETDARVVLVGRSSHCHVVAEHVRFEAGRLSFRVEGTPISVPLWGRHHLHAALAACAVGRQMNLTWDEITEALSSCQALPARCRLHRQPGLTVIDDTCQTGVASTRAAFEALGESGAAGRRVVVCGEWDEEETQGWEKRIGEALVTVCGADLLIACGKTGRRLIAAAQQAGLSPQRTVWCPSADTLPAVAGRMVEQGDFVLVKGQSGETVRTLIGWRKEHGRRAAA